MRILILAPTSRDATLTAAILSEYHIQSTICPNVQSAVRELNTGAGALLLAEEIIATGQSQPLADAIASQPPWSDLPVMLITAQGADSPAVTSALRIFSNVMLLERPTRVPTLVSSVQNSLRSRARQYQARDHLLEKERTTEALLLADRRKDEFLATLAHELRNPLAPIRNSLQILHMSAGNNLTMKRVCDMMERQVNHMVRMVDDLLEVSRVTRGQVDLRKEETDLATVIHNAVETSKPLIEAGQHELSILLPSRPIPVYGDIVRLSQVFSNLLNNAAKYTDNGGHIWLDAKLQGSEAVISVRDNGIGLSKDMLPAVFEMFMQVDRSTDRSQGGLGIGLTLVKSLVGLHDGTISAYSKGSGQGSEFIVRLPIAAIGKEHELKTPAVSQGVASFQRRVLVVDDNEDAAASLSLLLKYLGTDVQVANDGPTALASIESYQPDVVLLDIGMSGMDGFEVARRIREQRDCDNIVLIALTGWGQAEDRNRTQAAGFNHHLVKPADITALQSLLRAVPDHANSLSAR